MIKDFKFKIEEISEKGEFIGYASIYGKVDLQREVVEKGAFTKTIQEKKQFPLLWNHKVDEPIGIVVAKEDERGLRVWGKLKLQIQKAREIYELMKDGVVKGLSIGYKVIKDEFVGGVRRIKELKLYEISLVVFPANEQALVTDIKAEWTTAFINSLPDEAFAVIEPAYERGDTQDKRARHLPHHNKNVKDPDDDETIDLPHLRNALARVSQIKPITDSISRTELIEKALRHLKAHAKRLEIGEFREDSEELEDLLFKLLAIEIEKIDLSKLDETLIKNVQTLMIKLFEPSADTQRAQETLKELSDEPSIEKQILLSEIRNLREQIKKIGGRHGN